MKKLLALAVLVLAAGPALADNLYVPMEYPTIQAAVDAAHVNDIVVIAPGIYDDVLHEAGQGDTTKCVVVLKSGVTLQGAGAGITIIDALGRGRGIHCNGVVNASIENLTVRNAFAQVYGSAIFLRDGSSPTISRCELRDNLDGGLILTDNCAPVVSNCWITDNVGKEGGGIQVVNSSNPQILGCHILRNAAPSGGGLYFRGGSAPYLEGCIIADNEVNLPNGPGGGVGLSSSSATFVDCSIDGNIASGGGGGLYIGESTVTMTNCRVHDNRTTASFAPGGGVFADFNSSVILEGCTITKNVVEGDDPLTDGGGVCAYFATSVEITNCTIAENACNFGFGGGVTAWLVNPVIDKSIIAFNSPGAGLYCVDGSTEPVVSCTDLYGNAGGDAICGVDAGGNFSLDPLFCSIAQSDYRIGAASPCAPGNHPGGGGACDGSLIGGEPLGCTPVGVDPVALGGGTRLLGNLPNPFSGATTIRYQVAGRSAVDLRIFDASGRTVRVLESGMRSAGTYEVAWDGNDDHGRPAPAGVYFYRLDAGGMSGSQRMIRLQ